jgi:3',5'-cyclic AMP phosphodiesterase CpdA
MRDARAIILHISDLHFGRRFFYSNQLNRELLKQLKNLIRDPNVSPDYLVVSGDLVENPSPWAMRRAYDFICDLAQTAKIPPNHVLVVPGNHDYKVSGVIGLRRITRIPFEIYFRCGWSERGDWVARRDWVKQTRRKRWVDYIKLSLNAIWPTGQELRDRLEKLVDFDRRLVIFGINSTPLFEGFATGKISSDQISQLTDELENNRDQWDEAFKVVVVHHHPMPISYDAEDAKGRVEESLMVFYNAGLFLRELARHGIDLVLHGHKHFASFRRAVFDFEDGTRRSIGILAAGSTTHKSPSDPLGNEFNVIRLYHDGTATIDRWYYAANVRHKDESSQYSLYTTHDVRGRLNDQYENKYGLVVGNWNEVVTLTYQGYSQVEYYLQYCRVTARDGLDAYAFGDLRAERPCYIRGLELLPKGTTVVFPRIEPDANSHLWKIQGRLSFGEIRRPDGPLFNLAYTCRLMNGHALSFKEFQRRYKGRTYEGEELNWEFSTVECERVSDILRLIVKFPTEFDMSDIAAFDAVVYYLRVAGDTASKFLHDEETDRIKHWVRRDGQSLVLEVASPTPGFQYRVRWNYKTETSRSIPPLLEAGLLRDVRQKLIKTAQQSEDEPVGMAAYNNILGHLITFLSDISKRYAETAPGESLDISLAIFDEQASVLRFVVANFCPINQLFDETLMPGEGCAGFSFEKSRVIFYSRARDSQGYYIDHDEVEQALGRRSFLLKPEVLISIPWLVPGHDIPMGVITISSNSPTSRLVRVLDLSSQNQDEETKKLITLTQALGTIIIGQLTGRTLAQ